MGELEGLEAGHILEVTYGDFQNCDRSHEEWQVQDYKVNINPAL